MRRLKLQSPYLQRAVVPALIGGLGVPVCAATLGRYLGPLPLTDVVVYAAVPFAVLWGALTLGGRRGLVAIWTLMAIYWIVALVGALREGQWELLGGMRFVPNAFAIWSFTAFPFAIATALYLQGEGSRPPSARVTVLVLVVWFGLLLTSSYLASFALDVGGAPLANNATAWAVGLVLALSAFLVCCWLVLRLTKAESPV